ncbi:hypothetical protein SCHPADRAFT_795598, partial [Schizopora paradoxa]
IPKPQGEVGRPNRGGYNLLVELCKHPELGWNEQQYGRRYIIELVKEHLDPRKCYSSQIRSNIQEVEDSASSVHAVLKKYQRCWPLHDIIRQHLKYTSARARKLRV